MATCQFGIEDKRCQFKDEEIIQDGSNHFCQYHLPMEHGKSKATKNHWDFHRVCKFNESILKTIQNAVDNNEIADLSGVIFPSKIIFGQKHYRKDLGAIIFDNSVFYQNIDFRSVLFSGDASFKNAVFKKGVDFTICRFVNEANFEGVIFGGDKSDTEKHFSGGETKFNNVRFSSGAIFNGVKIFTAVSFNDAEFLCDTYFYGAQFYRFSSFKKTKFLCQSVDFKGAVFNIRKWESTIFHKTIFNGNVYFDNAVFNRSMLFIGCEFITDIHASHASFKNTRFLGECNFQESKFYGYVDFSCEFEEKNSSELRAFHEGIFDSTKFYGDVLFNNRLFKSKLQFDNAFFRRAPQFFNTDLYEDTTFYNAYFDSRYGEKDANRYRVLRLAMEELRDFNAQAEFFVLEQESIAFDKRSIPFVTAASLLYKIASEYGRSFVRPIFVFLVVQLFFAAYYAQSEVCSALAKSEKISIFTFTLKQIIKPFQSIFNSISQNQLFDQIIMLSHSVLSLSLFAIFLLALRRRFKMG